MDSALIGKIEKSMLYAKEPERITFKGFKAEFKGDHTSHTVTYDDGKWDCNCKFFRKRGACSHSMAMERMFEQSVESAELIQVPA